MSSLDDDVSMNDVEEKEELSGIALVEALISGNVEIDEMGQQIELSDTTDPESNPSPMPRLDRKRLSWEEDDYPEQEDDIDSRIEQAERFISDEDDENDIDSSEQYGYDEEDDTEEDIDDTEDDEDTVEDEDEKDDEDDDEQVVYPVRYSTIPPAPKFVSGYTDVQDEEDDSYDEDEHDGDEILDEDMSGEQAAEEADEYGISDAEDDVNEEAEDDEYEYEDDDTDEDEETQDSDDEEQAEDEEDIEYEDDDEDDWENQDDDDEIESEVDVFARLLEYQKKKKQAAKEKERKQDRKSPLTSQETQSDKADEIDSRHDSEIEAPADQVSADDNSDDDKEDQAEPEKQQDVAVSLTEDDGQDKDASETTDQTSTKEQQKAQQDSNPEQQQIEEDQKSDLISVHPIPEEDDLFADSEIASKTQTSQRSDTGHLGSDKPGKTLQTTKTTPIRPIRPKTDSGQTAKDTSSFKPAQELADFDDLEAFADAAVKRQKASAPRQEIPCVPMTVKGPYDDDGKIYAVMEVMSPSICGYDVMGLIRSKTMRISAASVFGTLDIDSADCSLEWDSYRGILKAATASGHGVGVLSEVAFTMFGKEIWDRVERGGERGKRYTESLDMTPDEDFTCMLPDMKIITAVLDVEYSGLLWTISLGLENGDIEVSWDKAKSDMQHQRMLKDISILISSKLHPYQLKRGQYGAGMSKNAISRTLPELTRGKALSNPFKIDSHGAVSAG